MAARDVKLYLSLKQAIIDKVANPELRSHMLEVDGVSRGYDYEYIFQIARRVFPQKYHLGHSYLHTGTTSQTNIAEASKEQLGLLNMEFAKDLVEGWGGTDRSQVKEKEIDPTLIEYENDLTAPDEPDYLYQELDQNALPEEDEEQEEGDEENQPSEDEDTPGSGIRRREAPRRRVIPQTTTPNLKEKLDNANRTMQETKKNLGQPGAPKLSESEEEKLNQATRSMQKPLSPPPEPPTPTSASTPDTTNKLNERLNNASRAMRRARPSPQNIINSRNRRRKAVASLLKGGGSSGFGIPWPFLRSLIRSAWNLGSRLASSLARSAAQLLPKLGAQAALQAGRSLIFGAGSAIAGLGAGPLVFISLIVGFVAFVIFDTYDSSSECGKAGTPIVVKTVNNGTLNEKQEVILKPGETEIEYNIQVAYQIKCGANFDVEIRDTIPENTEYVEGSSKIPLLIQYQTQGTVKYEAAREGRTLVWTIKGLPNRTPIDLTFRVKPNRSDVWIINEAAAKFTIYNSNGLMSLPLNLTGPSRGLMCTPGLDERLLRIFEEAGVAANVSPSILYGIAYAEKHGAVVPNSLDGKPPVISPCGAHGIMQIQHPNDGSGEDYPTRCVKEANGSPNPPETWNGLAAKYNELSGGNMVDPDSDKDSIFGGAFFIKDNGWPAGKNYTDQLTEAEAREIARRYLGDGLGSYGSQAFDAYSDAFKRQGTCGGGVNTGGITQQPVPGGVNAQ